MTADRLKFRCYRCSQLLAVAPNKSGAIVACPKCKADLVVPSAESPPAEPRQDNKDSPPGTIGSHDLPSNSTSLPTFLEGLGNGGIPPEVADLRPEDLRVEAEFFERITRPSTATEPAARTSAPSNHDPYRATLTPGPAPNPPTSWSQPPPAESVPILPAAIDSATTSVFVSESVVPSIQIETPISLAHTDAPRVIREVVLPASVVLAWSIFVLLGIAVSFLAGLVIGHFLWRPA